MNHWLVVEPPTPLKNDGVKVSWDDDIPNIWKVIKLMVQTTNQMFFKSFKSQQPDTQVSHILPRLCADIKYRHVTLWVQAERSAKHVSSYKKPRIDTHNLYRMLQKITGWWFQPL